MIAANRSRTLQVRATSCTRSNRQPPVIPRAAAAREASRRSSMARSNKAPRKVLLDDDNKSG